MKNEIKSLLTKSAFYLSLYSMEENQQQVENQLIDSARRILEIHYTHYNRIDQKAQWFLTLMGAVEGYFVINFFLNWKFDITDSS
ncbi:MAG: hypothetical protein LBD11_07105 [Candidatus Peribacteria bacterium]|nr:hypothetical protein [Candidatus Peribacteria bacterium]